MTKSSFGKPHPGVQPGNPHADVAPQPDSKTSTKVGPGDAPQGLPQPSTPAKHPSNAMAGKMPDANGK